MPATALYAKAKTALLKRPEVGLSGKALVDGALSTLDARLVGKDARVTLRSGKTSATFLRVEDAVYFKANKAFFRDLGDGAEQVIAILGDNWLRMHGEKRFSDAEDLTDRSWLAKDLLGDYKTSRKGVNRTILGVRCIALENESTGETLWVAVADGRPIQVNTRSYSVDIMSFTYEDVDAPEAPRRSQVLDSKVLSGG